MEETLTAAAIGAGAGAALTTAAESLRVALADREGERSVAETVTALAATSATSGLRSGVFSGLAKVIEITARNARVLSPLARTTAPSAIAGAILETAQAAHDYATNKIDRDELIRQNAATMLKNSGAWAYGVVGQTLVPVPVVGALVGSTVGYITSAVVMEGFKLARVAAADVADRESRLADLEVEILHAVKTLEEHRLAVEQLIQQEEARFGAAIEPMMDNLEAALTGGHDGDAFATLIDLNVQLGTELEWSTLPEFDNFMNDPHTSLIL